ncbi:hypothetical protein A3J17_00425 [Candidatus Curtissbacteria bacterium RIFCSPLOWO2_02_FULL_40_11]|uniref:UDP-N-acetylmuramate--L-alanine ligase n=2 Tax=Candidatus Curtissiibacteriota TaxID=1752717 RepID=A0A1F5G9T9_9BACT|nr:MAG: hypothetical protein A3D04_01030 [Candidatus Curtissbacteria bacterium RIFCSPHIGHO2_02_FULL_40_16b]OGE01524.1 MAG: hypothetical protein A3J17_00425 [Candidatus Curtissbacteria bacterium RIFCSPLOWO2_02_FULL_40_11]OGE13858.1 MAG: hypothetical protein A3G14_01770 [Candidatus Curtissbacteria bacterium RIFCSPLOWO2_12_FULL_38_9]
MGDKSKTKMKSVAAIVLAGGIGKRMKSKTSKVLHEIKGKPMILRTIHNLKAANVDDIIVVANPANINELNKVLPNNIRSTIQKNPKGTGDATETGLTKIKKDTGTLLVVNGDDSAFYKPETIKRVIKQHIETNSIQTFLTVKVANPAGLGRVLKKNGQVLAIIEEKEATQAQKKIKEINAGFYVFKTEWLRENISKIDASPATGEKYVVNLVSIATRGGQRVNAYLVKDEHEWYGINTKADLQVANEKFAKKIHIMGMAGAGASAVAHIAKESGFDVSGCDLTPNSSYVKSSKLKIANGHGAAHVHNIAMLIVSPAVVKNNPNSEELKEAKKHDIPTLTWQEFQGKFLQKNKFVISVAGGYGKSTTTAMISQIMISEGLDPTCEVGAVVKDWGTNYKVGKSIYYINEADEYADNFLNYNPDIAVILNIAWDHPDYFKNREMLQKSYQKFINNIKKDGYLIIGRDENLYDLAKSARKDIKVVKIEDFNQEKLSIIGDFRIINANAALTVAKLLKLDINRAKKSVQNFKGVARRLELKGEVNGAVVYDDYAVQPFTVLTTANALKDKFKDKKVVLVLEPHTFSRINTFYADFISALKKTNVESILVTNVFAAREKGDIKQLSKKLARSVGKKATYSGSIKESANYLQENNKNFDIILSMGAGDIYKLYDIMKSRNL